MQAVKNRCTIVSHEPTSCAVVATTLNVERHQIETGREIFSLEQFLADRLHNETVDVLASRVGEAEHAGVGGRLSVDGSVEEVVFFEERLHRKRENFKVCNWRNGVHVHILEMECFWCGYSILTVSTPRFTVESLL